MIRSLLLRGLAAGLAAGVLAGVVGLVVGEPSLDAAIAIEEAGEAPGHSHEDEAEISRGVQKAGLVAGSGLLGAVLGLAFGLAAGWAIGRLEGDAWTRSLKLGAVAAVAMVLLPALAVPANPPAVGDPDTVGFRTATYVLVIVIGLLLAAGGRLVARALAAGGMARPLRQTLLAAGGVVGLALILGLQPAPEVAVGDFPAELLWGFRLAALAVQLTLVVGIAAVFGLLSHRAERAADTPSAAATGA